MNHARKLYLDNIRWMTVVLVVIYMWSICSMACSLLE